MVKNIIERTAAALSSLLLLGTSLPPAEAATTVIVNSNDGCWRYMTDIIDILPSDRDISEVYGVAFDYEMSEGYEIPEENEIGLIYFCAESRGWDGSGVTNFDGSNTISKQLDEPVFAASDLIVGSWAQVFITQVNLVQSYVITDVYLLDADGKRIAPQPEDVFTTDNGLSYVIRDGEITIIDCTFDGEELIIPEEIDGLPVTSLGYRSFEFLPKLKSLYIPDSITNAAACTFSACDSLEYVRYSNNLPYIASNMFACCSSLRSFYVPDGVTIINQYAFAGCKNLSSLRIPESLTDITYYGLYGCESLMRVSIPNPEAVIVDSMAGNMNVNVKKKDFVIRSTAEESTAAEFAAQSDDFTFELMPETFAMGDVDMSGDLSTADAQEILNFTAKIMEIPAESTDYVDVSGDGKVSPYDAYLVLKMVAES